MRAQPLCTKMCSQSGVNEHTFENCLHRTLLFQGFIYLISDILLDKQFLLLFIVFMCGIFACRLELS